MHIPKVITVLIRHGLLQMHIGLSPSLLRTAPAMEKVHEGGSEGYVH